MRGEGNLPTTKKGGCIGSSLGKFHLFPQYNDLMMVSAAVIQQSQSRREADALAQGASECDRTEGPRGT